MERKLCCTAMESRCDFEPLLVLIVGAGPVGTLAALYFALNGHRVQLFEKYSVSCRQSPCNRRSINMTISPRGLTVLETKSLNDLLTDTSVAVDGRVVHFEDGSTRLTYYGSKNEKLYTVQRSVINGKLLAEAQNNKNIEIFFGHNLKSITSDGQLMFEIQEENGQISHSACRGDLVIGADGVHSKVRRCMFREHRLDYYEHSSHSHCYMEINVPAGAGGIHQLDSSKLHVWPRGQIMLILLPNTDGTFTGTIFMPMSAFHQHFTSQSQLIQFIQKYFCKLLTLMDQHNLVSQLLLTPDRRPNKLISNKSRPYHFRDSIVLVGDAAHAVVPFYGQGMNAGFEDIMILNEILSKYHFHKEHLGQALAEYSNIRCSDGDAINYLANEHYHQLCYGVSTFSFHLRHKVDSVLHRLFPTLWIPEYTMVSLSNIAYSKCRRIVDNQNRAVFYTTVMAGVCCGLLASYTLGIFVLCTS